MKFAHPSEQLFAEHLDLFDIPWVYEPTSFPLKWGSGAIKKILTKTKINKKQILTFLKVIIF